jgi:ATP-dependent helicase/nuclease subunit B
MAHIEQNIFKLEPAKSKAEGKVRIVGAPSQRSEVRFVADEILKLVQQRKWRYRDIAVIASDIDAYEHYVEAYFADHCIPFFIDKPKPLNQHPVAHLICSALQAVTGGFTHSDIFAYLKSDLVPMSRFHVDVLENYCLAFGLGPGDWTSAQSWHFAPDENGDFDQELIDRIRGHAIKPLLALQAALCHADVSDKTLGPEAFTRAVFNFLDVLDVRRTVARWIDEATAAGRHATAEEHRQFFDRLVDLFDELVEAFVGHTMSADDYYGLIKSAFAQMTLALVPPALDQVLVGSIERSRHPDLKAVFLIGATQRDFPVPVNRQTVLTDDDRSAAESEDFHLAPAASQSFVERQYLAYIAFTRPSEFLCVTYPCVDDKGSVVTGSQFVDQLQSLFEDLQEQTIAAEHIDAEDVHSRAELAELLCSRLGRDVFSQQAGQTEHLTELLADMRSDSDLRGIGSFVSSAVDYDNQAELDKEVVTQLFPSPARSSASRLSTLAACPYQHFARYSLALKERKEFKLEPLDMGNFYHRVLDSVHKRLKAEGLDFASVQSDRLLPILREQIAQLIAEDTFLSTFKRRCAHNSYIISSAAEVLEDCVLAVAEMVRAGTFRPILSEISFGDARDSGETLGEYQISLADGRMLSVDGKIDRLDVAEIGGRKIAVVFDYKRTDPSFSWSELYHGLDIQLPVYMLAVLNAAGSGAEVAAGAFCIPVETSIKAGSLEELPDKVEKFHHKAKGLFNGELFQYLDRTAQSGWSKFYNFRVTSGDQQYGDYGRSSALRPSDFEIVLQFTERKIIGLAEEILAGRINVKPYRLSERSACKYCVYQPVCRFDWQINDYNRLEALTKQEVLEKVRNI